MTQEAMARLCGVSPKTVGRWERGERLPDAGSYSVLMCAFEVNFRYLIGVHDKRYFIRADMIDADIWQLWNKMDNVGRNSLREMARYIVTQTAEKARQKA